MCAITGIVNFEPSSPVDDIIRRMTDAVTHRGPDDCVFLLTNTLCLDIGVCQSLILTAAVSRCTMRRTMWL